MAALSRANNDGLNTDAVITTRGDYGAVLAPYDTSTVFVRMLVRRSYEHGPPSYTVCLAGWPCDHAYVHGAGSGPGPMP